MEKFIEQIFSKQSPLHSIINNYEERIEQRDMALAVYQALKNKEKLFVEAGTGVGKSLAYLLPIGLWVKEKKEKVLISTYTKILQNQLIKKDIPILKQILHPAQSDNKRKVQNDKENNDDIHCAVIFGQENYVCRRRMASVLNHGLFDTPYEFSELEEFQKWLNKTGSGIIPEYPLILGRLAQKIGRDGDNCKFKKCPYYDNCYYFQARNEWFKADILIANHFLFFSNVEASYMILPKFDAVVFDEAHRLEEVAANFFGIEISNFGIHRLLNSIHNPAANAGILAHIKINNAVGRELDKMISEAHQTVDGMFTQFRNLIPIQAIKIGRANV
jgi:ATP-dependent DNA helicase DinG